MPYVRTRGMGAVHPTSCSTESFLCSPTTDCSQAFDYYTSPPCWVTSISDWQNLASLPAPPMPVGANPAVPTQAQLNQVSTSSQPGIAAQQLVNQLAVDSSSAAITQDQANNASFFQDVIVPGTQPAALPFCGAGSSQWFSGMDNCTVLEVAAAVVGIIIVAGLVKSRRR